MSRRGSFLVAAAASAIGFALVTWVASADSVRMLQSPTATYAPPKLARPRPIPGPQPQPSVDGAKLAASEGSVDPDLSWIDVLFSVLLVSVALIGLVLLVRWLWQQRWERRHRSPEVPFEVLPELSVALANDAQTQLAALQEGSPRNAIVACWLRLEEIAREAGVPSDPAETSTEFTRRVLGALAFDPAMINGFAGLYREARFSRHELGEPARRAAVAALRSLYEDIAAPGIPISSGVSDAEVR